MYIANTGLKERQIDVVDSRVDHIGDTRFSEGKNQECRLFPSMHESRLTITRFSSKKETAGQRSEMTWAMLCDVLSRPDEAINIDSLPLIKFSTLPNNSRRSGSVPENMTAIVGDYDDGRVSVDDAVKYLSQAGISSIVYTTRRHRPEAPRWRVVAQLSSPISCAEYSAYLDLLNGALGGILAPESWEDTRCYFYGRVAGVDFRLEKVPGLPVDIKAIDGAGWDPIGTSRGVSTQKNKIHPKPTVDSDREAERAITLGGVTDLTIHELNFALEAIKDRAFARDTWFETFLAMLSLKGTMYDEQARSMIEAWSKNHGINWGEKEDDDTKWDRENARDITFLSIFKWADDQDREIGVFNTRKSWRTKAKIALESDRAVQVGENVVSYQDFVNEMESPHYIWHRVLQKGCLYALTAKWGHGKTALMITVAMHIAVGKALGGHPVERQRVLYLCGENPSDVQLRTTAAAIKFGIDTEELVGQIFFTRRPFAIDNEVELARFVGEAIDSGPFGLVVIDTGPAHSLAEDENNNRLMHQLAMSMRDLMTPLGNPATVVLMHPAKEATRDNLQPRGGGAFSGSIDGELCAWQAHGQVEFFHRTKFRGPGFKPIHFSLMKTELPERVDNFGETVTTVLAVESDSNSTQPFGRKPLSGANAVAYQALIAALDDITACEDVEADFALEASATLNCAAPNSAVHVDRWREMAYDMGISEGGSEAKKKAFKRAREKLITDGLVLTWENMCWISKR